MIYRLSINNIKKTFNSRIVISDINIYLQNQECVGLLGSNGSGKTICFYIIIGLQFCDKGNIFLNEINITYYPIHKRARLGIGYLPQEPSIFRRMSVKNNILSILQLRKNLNNMEINYNLYKLMKKLNILHLENDIGISLSGGERRKVEIARALATNPIFLLLDEPFSGIDPISILEIKNIIKNLRNDGIGILITDHNVKDTLDICDRVYIINKGHILFTGTVDEMLTNSIVRKIYLGKNFSI